MTMLVRLPIASGSHNAHSRGGRPVMRRFAKVGSFDPAIETLMPTVGLYFHPDYLRRNGE
jgi:hypothetical protein